MCFIFLQNRVLCSLYDTAVHCKNYYWNLVCYLFCPTLIWLVTLTGLLQQNWLWPTKLRSSFLPYWKKFSRNDSKATLEIIITTSRTVACMHRQHENTMHPASPNSGGGIKTKVSVVAVVVVVICSSSRSLVAVVLRPKKTSRASRSYFITCRVILYIKTNWHTEQYPWEYNTIWQTICTEKLTGKLPV